MEEPFYPLTRLQEKRIAKRALGAYRREIKDRLGDVQLTEQLEKNIAHTMLAYLTNRTRKEAEGIAGEKLCRKVVKGRYYGGGTYWAGTDWLPFDEFGICAIIAGEYNDFVPGLVINNLRAYEDDIRIKLAVGRSPLIYVDQNGKSRFSLDNIADTLKARCAADEVDIVKEDGKKVVRAWWD